MNDRNLKIVLCANSSWYIYNFRKNTINEFLKKGHEVFVVAPNDKYTKYFTDLGAKHVGFNLNPISTNPFKEIMVIFSLIIIYIKMRPDFVMNFTPKMNIYSTIAAIFIRAKIVNNISGLGEAFSKNSAFSSFVSQLYRFTQRFAIKVFFQNKNDMNRLIEAKIVTKDRCDYLPGSGVDLERFKIVSAPNDEVIRFVIVSRMLYDKGVALLAEAAKYCKNKYGTSVEFNAVGFIDDVNPRAVPRKILNEWTSKGFLIYKGALEDVRPEIAISDCVVLPSVYPEGTPRSLLEAAAMGKPIITTDMPGCSSTVDHGINGFLCQPNSLNDLIVNLEKLIKMSHSDRCKMGFKSRELVVNRFDERIVIKKYLNCLDL
ncbi:glycosyltransferase family 4 protein [Woeseiaceae bacterium]|jgi:glycosyltransferase involved in cell wall biosynthesis|nr:glycosyltransferase family 4 protein [Woeseiaceae bacterium]